VSRRWLRPRPSVLALAACLSAGCHAPVVTDQGPPSVLLVVIDTLRRDHLKTYGYSRETAPTLSRLAAEGAAVDGISPTSWTKPAVASLFTGLSPLRHQSIGQFDRLPESARTLAGQLHARGYKTLGVTANGFSSARYGMDQGFDELAYLGDLGHGSFATAEEVNQEVERRLSTLVAPYFLFAHYLDPHAPYDPPDGGQPVRIQDLEMQTFMQRPPGFLARAIDAYDAEIRRADRALDSLLRRLSAGDGARPLLTVVVSDHGEEFQEHGRMGHGQTLYQEVLEVPIIFHWPGVIPAGSRPGRASLLDVFPTVLDLLQAKPAAGVDGISLATVLRTRRPAPIDRDYLAHVDVNEIHYLALLRGDRKLILGRYPNRKELFDLTHDPREQANIDAPDRHAGWEALARALAAAHNDLRQRALPMAAVAAATQDPQALAALGYVGGTPGPSREIPDHILPAGPEDDGLLGWEEPRHFKPCLEMASRAVGEQLVEGWYEADADGRWSWPRAVVTLPAPTARAGLTLHLRGARKEAAPARIRVRLATNTLLDAPLPPGHFELSVSAGRIPAGLVRLSLERTPAYVPALMGTVGARPLGDEDHRQLGVFWTAVCLADEADTPR